MNRFFLTLFLALYYSIALADLRWDRQRVELAPGPTDTFVDAAFGFMNSGGGPVTIEKIESSCGCTTASLPKMTLAPGERSELVVKFDIGDRRGQQTVTVVVGIKGIPEPVKLTLVVSIPEFVKIFPLVVKWAKGEEAKAKVISVEFPEVAPAKILSVVSNNRRMEYKLETIRNVRQYALVVTPDNTATGCVSVLTIELEFENQKKKTVRAYAQVTRY